MLLLASSNLNSLIYLDIGYKVILMNKAWLIKKHLEKKIIAISILLKLKNIGVFKYKLREFALITFYILGFIYDKTKNLCIYQV